MELARYGAKIVDLVLEGVTYTLVLTKLVAASAAMLALSEATKNAYNYVEGCARQVDNLAETAASLDVDDAVVSAHRDAAGVMRGVLADAQALSDEAAQMARDFKNAAGEHEADYGPVADAMRTKRGQVAHRTYYSNR
ncbi:hypothetical protein [Streptomyces sp. NPDC088360]|uniref:hypothetical protein n=1 Tax=Streptomyces sp. NPDC088360 TaxID=3154515 RepID=UPI00344FE262